MEDGDIWSERERATVVSGLLGGRRQRVCIGKEKSDWARVQKGVAQGSILGPLLFTIYVNDLPNKAEKCQIKQYADDTTMSYAADTVGELEDVLEKELNSIDRWVDRNHLKLNVKKTQLLLLGRKSRMHQLDSVKVSLNSENLSRKRTVKCLGVWADMEGPCNSIEKEVFLWASKAEEVA